MGKNLRSIEQTEVAKQLYNDKYNLLTILMERTTKEKLTEILHISGRNVRNNISELKMFYPVITNSKEKGYRLAKEIGSFESLADMHNESLAVEHTLNEIQSRIEVLKKEMKPLIAYLAILNREIKSKESELGCDSL